MSINFPEEQVAQQEAFKQYINQLFTDVERIWKRLTPEADWSPGAPSNLLPDIMGSPTNEEGGGTNNNIKIGTTAGAAFKGYWVDVNIKTWNGSAWAANGDTETCYLHTFDVAAGKNVVIGKVAGTSYWAVLSREC